MFWSYDAPASLFLMADGRRTDCAAPNTARRAEFPSHSVHAMVIERQTTPTVKPARAGKLADRRAACRYARARESVGVCMADEDRKKHANASGQLAAGYAPDACRAVADGFPRLRQSAGRARLDGALRERRRDAVAPRRPLLLRPDQHADDRGADDGADRARRAGGGGDGARAVGACRGDRRADRRGAAGKEAAHPRQRLRADPPLLRRDACPPTASRRSITIR